jgi:hypothetical protein
VLLNYAREGLMLTRNNGQNGGKNEQAVLRLFYLVRDEDVSGVSGIGHVAVGVIFPSGRVVLEWFGTDRSFGIHDSLDHVERIHGHGGKTRIVFAGIRDVSRLEGYAGKLFRTQLHNRWHSVKHWLGSAKVDSSV